MTPPTQERFNLQKARINRGHTVRSLAVEVEIDARTLTRLEEGKPVHPAKALKVAKYFKVQVTDLMDVETKAAA